MIRPALLAVALAAGAAAADPASAYERAFRRGNELFEHGDWLGARAEYEAAYAIEARPILLFNIASTYRREGDRVNARLYYRRYLDSGDVEVRVLAQKLVDELDAAIAAAPPHVVEPARAQEYPRAAIDRPLTPLAGVTTAGAGFAIEPSDRVATTGAVTTSYVAFASIEGAYAFTARIEAGLVVDLDAEDAARSVVFGQIAVAVVDGLSVRGTIATTPSQLYDVRLGAPFRWKLADQLALASDDDELVVTLDGDRRAYLQIPIGLGYQLTSSIYATLGTRPLELELSGPHATAFPVRAALAVTFVPIATLDVVLQARALAGGGDGGVSLRVRI